MEAGSSSQDTTVEKVADRAEHAKEDNAAASAGSKEGGGGKEVAIPIADDLVASASDDEKEKKKKDKDEEEEKKKANPGAYMRIFRYGEARDYFLLVVALFCFIGSGSALPLMTLVFASLINSINDFSTPGSGLGPDDFQKEINKTTLYFVYIFAGKFVLGYVGTLCIRNFGNSVSSNIRYEYVRAIFRQEIGYFDEADQKNGAGMVAVKITKNSNLIQTGISERLGVMLQAFAMFVSAMVVALIRNWRLALVILALFPAVGFIMGVTVPIDIAMTKKISAEQGKSDNLAEEVLSSIRTVLSLGAKEKMLIKYHGFLKSASKIAKRKAPLSGVQNGLAWMIIYAAYALAFWYGIRIYVRNDIGDVGNIVNVLFAVMIAVFSFVFMAPQFSAVSNASVAASEVFEVFDRQSKSDREAPGEQLDKETVTGDIEFRDVSFCYPSRPEITVINNLSVRFESKKVTALVGSSGCGKSTIVGLIERWYEPDSGTITLGGHSIPNIDLRWLRQHIGLVQQEPFLFNQTVYENVAFGMIGTEWENAPEHEKRQRVQEVCQQANADAFIQKLPNGYDTKISGLNLSGGQKQRIAIARAISSDPAILILDEATSAVDVKSEAIVQAALDEASRNRTTIMIAHRLATVKKADKIVVLKKGQAVEEGTHAELLEADGAYAKLVNAQAIGKGDDSSDDDERDARDLVEMSRNADDDLHLVDTIQSLPADSEVAKEVDVHAARPMGLIRIIALMLWEQRSMWFIYLTALVSACAGSTSWPIQAWLYSKIIVVFQTTDKREIERNGNFWALMYVVLAAGVAISYAVVVTSLEILASRLAEYYRYDYFRNILKQEVKYFDDAAAAKKTEETDPTAVAAAAKKEPKVKTAGSSKSSGTLAAMLANDATQLQNLLGMGAAFLVIAILSLIGNLVLGLIFAWKLALVCAFAAMPVVIGSAYFRMKFEMDQDEETAKVFAESAQFASEAVGAIRTVSSLTLEDVILRRLKGLLVIHKKRSLRRSLYSCLVFSMSESTELLAAALGFWYGVKLMSRGEITSEAFYVVFTAIVNGGQSVGQFLAFSNSIVQAKSSAQRMFMLRKTNFKDGDDDLPEDDRGGCDVEFKNVYFKYATRDTSIFRKLSFTIPAGTFAAFVGASGVGKTSTISILERFYDANSGDVLINGKEIRSLKVEEYRKLVSLVGQEPQLFNGTIKYNILLGVDREVSDEELEAVCKQAYIHDFVMSLPQGYSTECGAKGVSLSGGQKQRVAIARALIRKPKILLLDEATSALDSESEKVVQMAFEGAAHGRTMIAVAHRLSTIQKADVIFVMENGKIVEQGTHAQLLKLRGRYYHMCEAQALDK